jgi:hypothetical protein
MLLGAKMEFYVLTQLAVERSEYYVRFRNELVKI